MIPETYPKTVEDLLSRTYELLEARKKKGKSEATWLIGRGMAKKGTSTFVNFRQYFDVDLGRAIGTNGETKMRIVVDTFGELITAYPIP